MIHQNPILPGMGFKKYTPNASLVSSQYHHFPTLRMLNSLSHQAVTQPLIQYGVKIHITPFILFTHSLQCLQIGGRNANHR
jgi:hypothetical protein